ncbi:hypothetical protein C3432_05435 [Citrobacter amalonaticus]|uniref:Uncharacterized protein n=1 Tax=Citrobacter amalonaticus TaxID=35703 RepID=A0A2S4RPZ4_CITAM|nr:hypothetical protein C3432_05435 [Citrobacter amalonaticus]POT77060.1 hypothetical protein C3436_06385 [Citrobacter amalonaticus]POU59173.1 hypothetical protein C3430_26755 [Citrobacter amalonaticus]POV02368.1 hypothetical protein C3424_26820 [Citrobacter amalonaticus]
MARAFPDNISGVHHIFAVLFLYPSYFKLQMRWLHSLAPVTDFSQRPGTHSQAAFLQLELFRVLISKKT